MLQSATTRSVALLIHTYVRVRMCPVGSCTQFSIHVHITSTLTHLLHPSLSLQPSSPSPLPSKDDCLTHKERCLSSARLVALQISLLPQGLQVINLTQSELEVFLGKHASFQQVRTAALHS